MSHIIFTELSGQDGKIGLITLNRPEALNALTYEMITVLEEQLIAWETAQEIKAIVIRAVPGRAFCAGGDLRQLYQQGRNHQVVEDFFLKEYRLNQYIFHFPKPYIAFLDGITMGGGAGISIHGSHSIATENILFAMPETGIGFFPDIGATYFLSRLQDNAGIYLGLTGTRIGYQECIAMGLVDYYVPSGQLDSLLKAMTEISLTKDSVSKLIKSFSVEINNQTWNHKEEIKTAFANTTLEDILKALSTQDIINTIRSKSPTSLKVTLAALITAKNKNFDECIQTEYGLAQHFLKGHDLYEGIRAVLIDKDQKPHWQPAALADVVDEQVAMYFS